MNWLNELKVAYLNKNDAKITELMANTPVLKTRDEMFEALAVLEQIGEYARAQKAKLAEEMRKLKQTKNFLPKQERVQKLNLSF